MYTWGRPGYFPWVLPFTLHVQQWVVHHHCMASCVVCSCSHTQPSDSALCQNMTSVAKSLIMCVSLCGSFFAQIYDLCQRQSHCALIRDVGSIQVKLSALLPLLLARYLYSLTGQALAFNILLESLQYFHKRACFHL